MRVLLDAHIFGRVIGKALRDEGHDVRAIDADSGLEGLDDPHVLALAVAEERILITANVRDFVPLLAQHVAGGRSHFGCVLVPRSVRTEHFGALIRALRKTLSASLQEEWIDRIVWLAR